MGLGNSYFVVADYFPGGLASSVKIYPGVDVSWFASGVLDIASLHLLQLLPSWNARTQTFWVGFRLDVQLSVFRESS